MKNSSLILLYFQNRIVTNANFTSVQSLKISVELQSDRDRYFPTQFITSYGQETQCWLIRTQLTIQET